MTTSITLTVAQIADLAAVAGLRVSLDDIQAQDGDLEIVLAECPPEGIKDDDGVARHYEWIAYEAEYPEEGCVGIGPQVTPNAEVSGGRSPSA